ncbi:MAG: M20/M25/M40 family metallo-hydrolase [Thermoanaerobaculia bacterium]
MRSPFTALRRPITAAVLSFLSLSAPAALRAQTAIPNDTALQATQLRKDAMNGTKAFEIVRSLTVEAGPRPAGSKALNDAVAWGLRTMKELGFSNVRAEKVTVPHWVRGQESGEIVAPYPQPVVLAALGGSVGTPEKGIEAQVIEVPSLDAVDKLDPAQVKGKIVFYNVKMERAKDGSGYGRAVGVRGAGASRAAKLGAVAVLIRSIGTDNNRTPHTGAMRYQDGIAKIPAAALSIPDAEMLAAQIASKKPVTFRLKLGARMLPDVETANVVGEIPGREKPEEIVLLGCHLDSWDLGTGAIDDGAGCAIMMEAARRIGQLPVKPRRTVRVVLFANEEFGLSGAKAYAEVHKAELPRHVMAGESDFGAAKVYELSSRVDAGSLLGPVAEIAGIIAPLGISQGDNDSEGGADLTPMAPAQVPILALAQDGTYYFDFHHTSNDTLDKINPTMLDQNVAAWVAVAYAVADMPGTLGRPPVPAPRQ